MLSPAPAQFERLVRSKTSELVRPSSASGAHRGWPHPNGTLSSHSSPAPTVPTSALRSESVLPWQDVSDPKTVVLGGRESARACSRLAASNRSQGSAPKQPVRAPFGPGTAQGVVPLRKTPADNLVKSGTVATPSGKRRHRCQRRQRIRANLHSRV